MADKEGAYSGMRWERYIGGGIFGVWVLTGSHHSDLYGAFLIGHNAFCFNQRLVPRTLHSVLMIRRGRGRGRSRVRKGAVDNRG